MNETTEVMNNEFAETDVPVDMEETESRGFVSTALEGCGALALAGGVGYGLYRGGKYVLRKIKARKHEPEEVVTVTEEELTAKQKEKPKKDKSK